jgi:hypothetical protein
MADEALLEVREVAHLEVVAVEVVSAAFFLCVGGVRGVRKENGGEGVSFELDGVR